MRKLPSQQPPWTGRQGHSLFNGGALFIKSRRSRGWNRSHDAFYTTSNNECLMVCPTPRALCHRGEHRSSLIKSLVPGCLLSSRAGGDENCAAAIGRHNDSGLRRVACPPTVETSRQMRSEINSVRGALRMTLVGGVYVLSMKLHFISTDKPCAVFASVVIGLQSSIAKLAPK